MSKYTDAIVYDLELLAEDAQALLEATAEAAGEKIHDARKRLGEALDKRKKILRSVENEAIREVHAAAQCVLDHPYKALATGLALGIAVGWIASHCPKQWLR